MLSLDKILKRLKVITHHLKYLECKHTFRIFLQRINYRKTHQIDIPLSLEVGQKQWKANTIESIFMDKQGNYVITYRKEHELLSQYCDILGNHLVIN